MASDTESVTEVADVLEETLPVVVYRTNLHNVVQDALSKRPGWVATKSKSRWDFAWMTVKWIAFNFDSLNMMPHARINHFRQHLQLTGKDHLVRNLRRLRELWAAEGRSDADMEQLGFLPESFILPGEYSAFLETFGTAHAAGDEDDDGAAARRRTWILKPVGGKQGNGIFLINRLDDAEFLRAVADNQLDSDEYRLSKPPQPTKAIAAVASSGASASSAASASSSSPSDADVAAGATASSVSSDAGVISPADESGAAGVTSSSDAGVTSSSDAGVTSSSDAGVTSSSDAGVTSSSDAAASSSSDAGVTSSSDAGVTSSSDATAAAAAASSSTDAGATGDAAVPKPKPPPGPVAYIAQRYIADPYLLNGCKFDCRIYVLVTSYEPLTVWLYRGAFGRVAVQPYVFDPATITDKFVHLTNVAIQKEAPLYNAATGCKWQIADIIAYVARDRGDSAAHRLLARIQDLIIHALHAARLGIVPNDHCFELYGYDVMWDADLKPWLLEINASPSMVADTDEDYRLKRSVINDVLDIIDLEGRRRGDETMVGGFEMIWRGGVVSTASGHSPLGQPIPTLDRYRDAHKPEVPPRPASASSSPTRRTSFGGDSTLPISQVSAREAIKAAMEVSSSSSAVGDATLLQAGGSEAVIVSAP